MSTNPAAKPYFLRGYKIVVNRAGQDLTLTDSKWEPEALRAKFKMNFLADQEAWYGEVTIWNLSPTLEQTLLGPGEPTTTASGNTPIVQGDLLTISAGYQVDFDPVSNILFQGPILQPLWDREDVTDFKMTLRAIIDPMGLNHISVTMGPYQTQLKVVSAMAEAAHTPIEQVDENGLPTQPLPRSKSVFATPRQVLENVQRTTNMRIWISEKGLNVRPLNGVEQPADVVFGPSAAGSGYKPTAGSTASYTPTLIGTPQATQQGILFRVLIDSRIKVGAIVKINQAVIRQLPLYINAANISVLDRDGAYVVTGMTHQGDTRGQEWYTDVTAVTLDYWANSTLTQASLKEVLGQ